MNNENKKLNISEELSRAEKAYRSANLLFENDLISDAVSKLYYYLLYHIRAILLSKDLEPRSHEGALRLFSLHFVKTGVFDTDASHVFSKMMKFREEADYNPSYSFTGGDFTEFQDEVEKITRQIKDYLSQQNLIEGG